MRKHGLAIDNLLAAEVVTAEGRVVQASADENPDLFWALRGGGGNFGVVTAFRFALHPVGPTVLAGPIFWAADDARDVLRFYREFIAEIPDELGTIVKLCRIPPQPIIPAELHWRPAIGLISCYAGTVDEGERVMEALRRFGSPLVDRLEPRPYAAFQGGFDDTVPHGWHYYWKSTDLSGLTDETIDVIVDHVFAANSPRSYAAIFHSGGAVSRVSSDATAFGGREAGHHLIVHGAWLPEACDELAEPETLWARGLIQALGRQRDGGVYVNFLDADDGGRVRDAYGDRTYRHLAEVKAAYDPDNVFHRNQNIRPA
jgi:FAD/FMN-containing dehydrogenase